MGFFWSIFSCFQSEYKKIRIRKNSVFGHFSRSELTTGKCLLEKGFTIDVRQVFKCLNFVHGSNSKTVSENIHDREGINRSNPFSLLLEMIKVLSMKMH